MYWLTLRDMLKKDEKMAGDLIVLPQDNKIEVDGSAPSYAPCKSCPFRHPSPNWTVPNKELDQICEGPFACIETYGKTMAFTPFSKGPGGYHKSKDTVTKDTRQCAGALYYKLHGKRYR